MYKRQHQDGMKFRRNLERMGELLAYEISKSLRFRQAQVTTPLEVAETRLLRQPPVLATILRTSLPFHQGFLNIFDQDDNAFIGACLLYTSKIFFVQMFFVWNIIVPLLHVSQTQRTMRPVGPFV